MSPKQACIQLILVCALTWLAGCDQESAQQADFDPSIMFDFTEHDLKPQIKVCESSPHAWQPYPRLQDCTKFRHSLDNRSTSIPVVIDLYDKSRMPMLNHGFMCVGVQRRSSCWRDLFRSDIKEHFDETLHVTPSKCRILVDQLSTVLKAKSTAQSGNLDVAECWWLSTVHATSQLYTVRFLNLKFDRQSYILAPIYPVVHTCHGSDQECELSNGGTLVWNWKMDTKPHCEKEYWRSEICILKAQAPLGPLLPLPWTILCPRITSAFEIADIQIQRACTLEFDKPIIIANTGNYLHLTSQKGGKEQEWFDSIMEKAVGKTFEKEKNVPSSKSAVSLGSGQIQYTALVMEAAMVSLQQGIWETMCMAKNDRILLAMMTRHIDSEASGQLISDDDTTAIILGDTAIGILSCRMIGTYRIIPEVNQTNEQKEQGLIPIEIPKQDQVFYLDPLTLRVYDRGFPKRTFSPKMISINTTHGVNTDSGKMTLNVIGFHNREVALPHLRLSSDDLLTDNNRIIYRSIQSDIESLQTIVGVLISSGEIIPPGSLTVNVTHGIQRSWIGSIGAVWGRWIRNLSLFSSLLFMVLISLAVIMCGCYCCCLCCDRLPSCPGRRNQKDPTLHIITEKSPLKSDKFAQFRSLDSDL